MPIAQWPRSFRLPSRHIVLFIGAVIVPCGALIIRGARVLSRDGELANSHYAAERRRVSLLASDEIIAQLQLLRSRQFVGRT